MSFLKMVGECSHSLIRHGWAAMMITPLLSVAVGCRGPRPAPGPGVPAPRETPARGSPSALLDPTDLYQRNGMIARTTPMAFVGSVRFLPTSSADSTLVLVALSMPNRSLTFAGAGDRQEAGYTVITEARQGGVVVQRREAREMVRVASFRETTRGDESVIFQQFMTLSPGDYDLAVIVRDAGSARSGAYELPSSVPRLVPSTIAPPVIAYEARPRTNADSLPQLIANPRATIVFGRDTVVPVYIEQATATGAATEATLSVLSDQGNLLWSDTVSLQSGTGIAGGLGQVPATRFGVGHFWITTGPVTGAAPAGRVPLFISFGDEWGIAPLEEMLSYLRYFADASRLRALQDAVPEGRASAWMTFWRETDPDPQTTEHEGLRDYFRRLITANERFRDEASTGWLTERGKVFITLGEPDQILEQGDAGIGNRGRVQIWQYLQHRAQFVFVDQSGFGRWRMTPASEAEFESIAVRVRRR
jgi:GWxTD domain-containing protein